MAEEARWKDMPHASIAGGIRFLCAVAPADLFALWTV